MPLYFFHCRAGDDYACDTYGLELPDPESAHAAAVDGVRSILSDEVRCGRLQVDQVFEVEDEYGRLVATVPFREAVQG